MTINFDDILEIAEQISNQANEYDYSVDTNLHREVQKLSVEWWMDFILGIYIASCI